MSKINTWFVPNRLAGAISPYLQQHADNPVDWREWSPEVFAEARLRDVPVLLSVGYAACHWCHVMAHESFEDPRIGALINEHFVAVKVDREERPDIDAVYMRATQLMTGSGGWPMTVFLDHEGRPFHAGTYYPPTDRHGLPSFERVLLKLSDAWRHDRPRVAEIANSVADAVQHADRAPQQPTPPAVPEAAVRTLQQAFDPVHAGFGDAPKFPPSMVLEFLLRHHARTGSPQALRMVEATCEAMARGGMYDQLGGGFARYSVDAAWVVPHFEKMLYDNALLARLYLHLWRVTGSALARRVATETCEFLLRELRTEQGGFAASLDADSDPAVPGWEREGAFYVWTADQLGVHAELLAVTEGPSVLQLRRDPPPGWPEIREHLRAVRDQRPRPARDDKVVAGWNGLAIAALAEAGFLLEEPDFLEAARAAAELLLDLHLVDGRLRRVSRDGRAGTATGVLEDYAGAAEGLLALYQCTGEPRWLHAAGELLVVAREFGDGDGGYFEARDEQLLTRTKDPSDNATPAGWTLLTGALLGYAALTGDEAARTAADASIAALLTHPVARHPRFLGWGLAVLEAQLAGPLEVAVIGEAGDPLHRTALMGASPGLVVAVGSPGSRYPALLEHRSEPAAYVCRRFACELPITDPIALARRLGAATP